jgi:hypothetical protein
VKARFSEAAANTAIFPVACEGWEGDDEEGDFELHATEPANKPATSIVNIKQPRTPIRRMVKP